MYCKNNIPRHTLEYNSQLEISHNEVNKVMGTLLDQTGEEIFTLSQL